ncbi:MAG: SDR family oxidoreductase [Thermaerobacter sp.]|nr:SDR family oxidoreductase [Thermaerobacter sp.]
MLDLTGRVALVTGSSRGIGRAIAERYAAAGARVIVHCDQSRDDAREVVRGIAERGGEAMALFADVADPGQVRDLFEDIDAGYGRLDVLVNCAGRNRDRPFLEMTDDDFRVTYDSQLRGTILCSQNAARRMLAQGSGSIINIGAATGLRGRKNGANYCVAKAGVMVLTKVMAQEFAPTLRVHCLVPGYTETDEVLDRFSLRDPERLASHVSGIPLGKLASPGDIADWALWLAAGAPHATGQYWFVNGGAYMG